MLEALNNIALVIVVTCQILIYFWFITFTLIILCFYFLYSQKPTINTLNNRLISFAPFLLTIMIVVCGGVFYANNSLDRYYPLADNIIYGLLLLHFPIFIIAILQTKESKGFIIILSILQFYLSFTAGFVSLMSVQNAWL